MTAAVESLVDQQVRQGNVAHSVQAATVGEGYVLMMNGVDGAAAVMAELEA